MGFFGNDASFSSWHLVVIRREVSRHNEYSLVHN